MTDKEIRPDFREAFYNEADQLHKDLVPLAELMRRHATVVRLIMRTEHLALSAAEQAVLLGKEWPE